MEKYYRVYADIDLDAIYDNVKGLKSLLDEKTGVIAVIKADGYGHGAVPIAKKIGDLVAGYAVATVYEGVNLRINGIDKPILILGYTFEADYDKLIEYDITATVFDLESVKKLSEYAIKAGKVAKCHIKVDTGMRRIGMLPTKENAKLVKEMSELGGIDIEGIFTHFASSDECDKTFANNQFKLFNDFIDMCNLEGVNFKYRHCANSAAIIDMPQTSYELSRAGIAMYGLYPSEEVDKDKIVLKPAMSIHSHVTYVKTVKKGEGISYGSTYVPEHDIKVATIPVGYGDGYPRSLSNKGYVLINGKKAYILGRVCMDQFMVDVSDIDNVCTGTLVTLIGRDGDDFISVEEIANLSGSFNYEFVCDVGKRIPRCFYSKGHFIGSKDYFDEIYEM